MGIVVKRYVAWLGYDVEDFAGYSLRAGFATSAAGKSERAIMTARMNFDGEGESGSFEDRGFGIVSEREVRPPAPEDLTVVSSVLPVLFLPSPRTSGRFWEFFTVNIRNKNTRRAYYNAACRFAAWCEGRETRRVDADQADARGGLRRGTAS